MAARPEGGQPHAHCRPNFDEGYERPAFSPDERFLAYFSTSSYDKTVPETMHIADTATGKVIAAFEAISPVGWMGWVP